MADPVPAVVVAGGFPPRFWTRLAREVVAADGPDATAYLQGQLSQDVAAIPVGGAAWSWLLAPNGKVDALVRVVRRADDSWLIETDAGWGEAVLARLGRFKLRMKVDLEVADVDVVGLRGDGWDVPAAADALGPGPVLMARPPWPGVDGADLLVLPPAPGSGSRPATAGDPIGAGPVDAASYEAWRIAAGIPRMGSELTEWTIPAETGLVDEAVSFTKGCYTGQELVARIDSRGGNVPRRLWVLTLDAPVEAGTELSVVDGDGTAGTVTSVATSPDGHVVALAFVRRGTDPAAALVAGPGGPPARLERPAAGRP